MTTFVINPTEIKIIELRKTPKDWEWVMEHNLCLGVRMCTHTYNSVKATEVCAGTLKVPVKLHVKEGCSVC